ncbi:NADH-quinone oxidoreductase subunit C [Evansella vedderi]|uniref:NADH-quinone oxidoreductase n=1 Tax=Evansella vedderi TaxID=38282 RepID=A0ABU0A143_9BACI|nr:NADH-quinone oxidoreductase subunit C [Evansella vedderi]MDQ0257204.1 NADH-quinone oxidoreductase subunit C [Evansella vedderi]
MSQEVLDLIVKKVDGFLGEEVVGKKPEPPPEPEPEEEPKAEEAEADDPKAKARAARAKKAAAAKKAEEPKPPARLNFGKPLIELPSEKWSVELAELLRDDPELQFDFLSCITGVDYEEHMEVVYNFYSTVKKHYLYLKVITPREKPSVVSVDSVWKAADYMEREIYDLLGVDFPGHWNLKRILLDDGWEGHPLRKDYITDKKALGLD